MNESGQPQNVWPTVSQVHGATPANALHTLLEFVIDNREMFKDWLNRRLAENGSRLVLGDEDINEALAELDDLLHIAMRRPRENVRRVQVSPEVLRMVMERIGDITDEEISGTDTDGINVIKIDPDENTGMYL